MRRTAPALLVPIAALTLLAGCSSSDSGSSDSGSSDSGSSDSASTTAASASPGAETGTLTVFAAASLKSTFTELGTQFEAAHPGVTVTFNFAGSSDLVNQITSGAPADVFASADTATMDKAVNGGVTAGQPTTFATNTLEIATEPGNPKGITTFADLAEPGTTVVVCAAQVPCGSAEKKVETATGTALSPVSEESSVTDVLNKVTSGEADAGVVYVTDVRTAGEKVTGVGFPEASAAVNSYPIVPLSASTLPQTATAFSQFVAGPQGQAVLSAAGFAAP